MNKQEQITYYRVGLGKINKEDFTYINTTSLQVSSVVAFMDVMGYDYNPIYNHTFTARHTYSRNCGFKGCDIISFNTAVGLHDSEWVKTYKEGYFAPTFKVQRKMDGVSYNKSFFVDAYTISKANAARIVQRVYVHASKNGQLKAYKDQIKFANVYFEDLFLRPMLKKQESQDEFNMFVARAIDLGMFEE